MPEVIELIVVDAHGTLGDRTGTATQQLLTGDVITEMCDAVLVAPVSWPRPRRAGWNRIGVTDDRRGVPPILRAWRNGNAAPAASATPVPEGESA